MDYKSVDINYTYILPKPPPGFFVQIQDEDKEVTMKQSWYHELFTYILLSVFWRRVLKTLGKVFSNNKVMSGTLFGLLELVTRSYNNDFTFEVELSTLQRVRGLYGFPILIDWDRQLGTLSIIHYKLKPLDSNRIDKSQERHTWYLTNKLNQMNISYEDTHFENVLIDGRVVLLIDYEPRSKSILKTKDNLLKIKKQDDMTIVEQQIIDDWETLHGNAINYYDYVFWIERLKIICYLFYTITTMTCMIFKTIKREPLITSSEIVITQISIHTMLIIIGPSLLNNTDIPRYSTELLFITLVITAIQNRLLETYFVLLALIIYPKESWKSSRYTITFRICKLLQVVANFIQYNVDYNRTESDTNYLYEIKNFSLLLYLMINI